jgi:tetratricopeptide (TPR) repeat protein
LKNFLLTLIVLGFSCGVAYGADEHGVALQYYAKGDYKQASTLLQAHIKHKPFDWNAHFYLANCYSKLGMRAEAITHYKLIQSNSPNSEVASSSAVALENLENLVRTEHALEMAKRTHVEARPVERSHETPPDIHAGSEHQRAEADIQRQSSEIITKLEQERAAVSEKYRNERDRINTALEQDIRSVPRTYGHTSRRRGYYPIINNDYDATVDSLRERANARIDDINSREKNELELLNNRLNAISGSGTALYNQLHEVGGERPVKPAGTNLYIRNYGQ